MCWIVPADAKESNVVCAETVSDVGQDASSRRATQLTQQESLIVVNATTLEDVLAEIVTVSMKK